MVSGRQMMQSQSYNARHSKEIAKNVTKCKTLLLTYCQNGSVLAADQMPNG